MWSDGDEKSLTATHAALEALKVAGGDTIAEKGLLNRLSILNKKKGGSTNKLVHFLREQGMHRQEDMKQRGREREGMPTKSTCRNWRCKSWHQK